MMMAAGNETGPDLLCDSSVQMNSADTLIHHYSTERLLLWHTLSLSHSLCLSLSRYYP